MIEIYVKTKIYILCPSNFASGGPELLHQLAYNIRKYLNVDAYILYYPQSNNPVRDEYKDYNVPYVFEAEDIEDNILIVPEIKNGIDISKNYKYIRKILWFLSIDNFYLSRLKRSDLFLQRIINKTFTLLTKKQLVEIDINKMTRKKKIHIIKDEMRFFNFYFVQSYYALNYIQDLEVDKSKIYFISDYLNIDFLNRRFDINRKENIVVYNPKKGFLFTQKIVKQAKGIQFIPLINMTREEVIKTLQKAKVYIDFGNHPGKDRLPREAAILGCCVITGKRGSAAYYEDIPIPNQYKFEDKKGNIPKIIDRIQDCLNNYEKRYKDFDYYRDCIRKEPEKFIEDMGKIFLKV